MKSLELLPLVSLLAATVTLGGCKPAHQSQVLAEPVAAGTAPINCADVHRGLRGYEFKDAKNTLSILFLDGAVEGELPTEEAPQLLTYRQIGSPGKQGSQPEVLEFSVSNGGLLCLITFERPLVGKTEQFYIDGLSEQMSNADGSLTLVRTTAPQAAMAKPSGSAPIKCADVSLGIRGEYRDARRGLSIYFLDDAKTATYHQQSSPDGQGSQPEVVEFSVSNGGLLCLITIERPLVGRTEQFFVDGILKAMSNADGSLNLTRVADPQPMHRP